MKHDETVSKMEGEGRGRGGREGSWGGGGATHREAINLSLQVSPGADLLPSSPMSLLTGFKSPEAVEVRASSSCFPLVEAALSSFFFEPLHNMAACFIRAVE